MPSFHQRPKLRLSSVEIFPEQLLAKVAGWGSTRSTGCDLDVFFFIPGGDEQSHPGEGDDDQNITNSDG